MYIKNKFWFGGKYTFLQVIYIYIAISTLKGIFPRFIDGIIKKRLFFCRFDWSDMPHQLGYSCDESDMDTSD